MTANLDIDALHATWEAAMEPDAVLNDWINAVTPSWPAIYERLRELEAERDSLSSMLAQARVEAVAWAEEVGARAEREAALRQIAEDTLEYLRTRHADGTWSSVAVGDFCTSRAAVAERARTEGE